MSNGFYKQDIQVLKFDINKDIDLIRFDHYIKQKENLQRLKEELQIGQFYMTIRNVELDLSISYAKAQRIIKKFEQLNIIRCIFKAKNNTKDLSIYEYISMIDTQKHSNNADLKSMSDTQSDKNNKLLKLNKIDTQGDTQGDTQSDTQESSKIATLKRVSDTQSDTQGDTQSDTSKIDNKKDNKKDIYNEQKVAQNRDLNKQLEKLWKEYPKKIGKAKAFKKLPKIIKEYGFEQILRAITRYVEEVQDKEYQFVKQGDTFFNGAYIDYLDNNYDELLKEKKELQEQQQKTKEQVKKIKQPTLVTEIENKIY